MSLQQLLVQLLGDKNYSGLETMQIIDTIASSSGCNFTHHSILQVEAAGPNTPNSWSESAAADASAGETEITQEFVKLQVLKTHIHISIQLIPLLEAQQQI